METNGMLLASLVLLTSAFILGAVDGVYFHLQRFRLFACAESRQEHCLHTVRAWLAVASLVLLYLIEPAGPLMIAAAAVVLADQVVLVADLVVEQRSRRSFGGIPHAEYMVHVAANGLHAVALALAFASRPLERWTAAATWFEPSALPVQAHWLVAALLVAATVAAIQHVALLRTPLDGQAGLAQA